MYVQVLVKREARMELIRYDEMKKTWYQIARNSNGNIPPSFELEVYKKLLNLFHVGSFYYYIVNIASVEMEFVSDTVEGVLGFRPDEFSVERIFENIHPEDKQRFVDHERQVTTFFNQLPPEKVLKYKVSYDYRLKCADGSYKWILMQTVTVQTNEQGAVIRVLGVQTDITHMKTDNRPSGLSFLGLEGEPSFYNVPIESTVFIPTKKIFTKREAEVLKLIVNGLTSFEIADLLCISMYTVNSHRKNILRKSGCGTPNELVSKAIREGWV